MTFGIARGPEEQRNRVWLGDREYRECKLGEEVRILLKFLYSGAIDSVELVWVLEDAEDRIEMRHPLQGHGGPPAEMNLGFTGLIPENAVPGRYNLESLKIYYADRRHVPLDFEPPKVGLLVKAERIERPQFRGFDFE